MVHDESVSEVRDREMIVRDVPGMPFEEQAVGGVAGEDRHDKQVGQQCRMDGEKTWRNNGTAGIRGG